LFCASWFSRCGGLLGRSSSLSAVRCHNVLIHAGSKGPIPPRLDRRDCFLPVAVGDRSSQCVFDAAALHGTRCALDVTTDVSPSAREFACVIDLDTLVGRGDDARELSLRSLLATDDARAQGNMPPCGGHLRLARPPRRRLLLPPPPRRRLPPPVRAPRTANSSMSSANRITPLSFPPPRLMFQMSSGRS